MAKIIIDLETTGLSPIELITKEPRLTKTNRILSIGVWDLNTNTKECFTGEDEKNTLTKFSEFLLENNGDCLIGFNCQFDLNFIRVRSFALGVQLPFFFNNCEITDLRKTLNTDIYAYGKLGEYAELIGCEVKTENGSHMPEFYKNKQWDKISEHNLEDLELTYQLYKRCDEVNLL
jgi:DNA polymerase III epsilon subunit-like protein